MNQTTVVDSKASVNSEFKKSYGSLFWVGIAVAVGFHALVIFLGPSYRLTKEGDREVKVMKSEDIIEVKIEVAAPPTVAAPAMPVPTDNTEIPLDATIQDTEFNPYAPPPPPPPTSGGIDDVPVFVAYEDPPEPVKMVKPKYPELAQEAQIEGKVVLNVLVDEEGNVRKAIVIKGVPNTGLDEAAIEAVLQWKYKPALQRGKPVKVWVAQTIKFELED